MEYIDIYSVIDIVDLLEYKDQLVLINTCKIYNGITKYFMELHISYLEHVNVKKYENLKYIHYEIDSKNKFIFAVNTYGNMKYIMTDHECETYLHHIKQTFDDINAITFPIHDKYTLPEYWQDYFECDIFEVPRTYNCADLEKSNKITCTFGRILMSIYGIEIVFSKPINIHNISINHKHVPFQKLSQTRYRITKYTEEKPLKSQKEQIIEIFCDKTVIDGFEMSMTCNYA